MKYVYVVLCRSSVGEHILDVCTKKNTAFLIKKDCEEYEKNHDHGCIFRVEKYDLNDSE
jgi:hypothetical protein